MNEPQNHRAKLAQLVTDYDWLEDYCRKQPDLARHAGHLRLAAALARNVLGGALERQPASPLHIAVVGGAGAGKSTVANFLAGTIVAEANPQAGYTRHPTAYVPIAQTATWPSYLGYLGPLRQLSEKRPSNFDEDVYQVHRITGTDPNDPLAEFVIWDCPDMTTWVSTGYVPRLIEVAALADVIVYVASDERYNDEVPTQFLQLLIQAGKAVVVVLTKMRSTDMAPLMAHFQTAVLAKIPDLEEIPPVPVVAFPAMSEAERKDPTGAGAKYRVQLLNQILVLCPSPDEVRQRTIRNAMAYLQSSAESLLEVARKDLNELELWKSTVDRGRRTFEDRYRREYLISEPFRRFDRSRQQLLEMLRPPGPLRYVDVAMTGLRMPFTYARDFFVKMAGTLPAANLPEQTVLSNAMISWLEEVQAESIRRSGTHAIWQEVSRAFDSGLKQQAMDQFQVLERQFELKEGDELETAGRSLTEKLTARPKVLAGLRTAKIATDLGAVGATLWITWIPEWYHLLLLPVAATVSHSATEVAIRAKVEAVRSAARAKRESLLQEHLSEPLANWLEDRPSTGGTDVERLQLVLRRVPESIRELSTVIHNTKSE